MLLLKHVRILISIFLLLVVFKTNAQEQKRIKIMYSGFAVTSPELGEGVREFRRDNSQQVHFIHEGVNLYCDKALYYENEDFIEAFSNVNMQQGDTINMTSKYAEYSGKTQLAFARGDVVLTEPQSVLTTDKLYFDRTKQQAYYTTGGRVVRDTSGTITSTIGRYYMSTKKYQFVDNVVLVNPEYVLKTNRLDFFTENGHAYMYGPSTIVGETSTIYCERGFYNTNNDTGYFIKNSRIDYDNRVVVGDSIYFNRNTSFASATNNITVTDTINNSIVRGHYAEVFREKDSVFITKRALAISVQENDSIYMRSDTLMLTGPEEHRITRAFYNVRIFKSDLSGKADSVHVDHKKGLTQMINLKRFSSGDAFSTARKPILWNMGNQMTGDTIHLISNVETEKLDSLKVFNNAFLISKDSLSDGYNQIKGQILIGLFRENELYNVDIIKNAEVIYYAYNDENELVGIDKSKSATINIQIEDSEITEISKLKQIDGMIYPEEDFPKNARIFRGFDWRGDEQPMSVEDLFKDDPPLILPVIRGLDEYIPQEEFFDEALMERVEATKKDKDDTTSKAARHIPTKETDTVLKQEKVQPKISNKKD
ncbi:OstA-like protein [Paucihalobacter sp.]|uniref:OstA-like protein n=1 Tax=Paucihalobacter sp. TaxID=2850405 RepID=UPI003D160668